MKCRLEIQQQQQQYREISSARQSDRGNFLTEV